MKAPMTTEEYRKAVETLVALAQTRTSGGRAAAQVVLSAYNGTEWQLDVTDLCLLDPRNYQAALALIRGRVELRTEPHTLIKNGNEIFDDLWDRWERYHVSNRWKDICQDCIGSGDECNDNGDVIGKCRRCGGSGLIAEDGK